MRSIESALTLPLAAGLGRPRVKGKFLFAGDKKVFVRGVTYGTFRPGADGTCYPEPAVVEQDFASMVGNGINALRTYTVPPTWLLDIAAKYGIYVMVGLAWEQHITFLDEERRRRSIEERVRAGIRDCAGHPAVLCYTIGSEIPAPIVRWYGHRRIQRFLKRLYRAAKEEDPEGLVTYVNYPTTEYLELPFIDLVCFNVYLESQDRLEAYLARLQNLAGERPLVMAEIGLDSCRHGEDAQALSLEWQIRVAFAAGCAGAFVFSWTDEWYRGGYDIDDWDFGLTRRDRNPKPALAAVRWAFEDVPFPKSLAWPRVSVVVCSYNGARTIRDCLEGLSKLDYPDYEVILVNDGSADGTADIGREYGFRVISTENRGLSSARNTGLEAATGEIVAYIDDDAYPDPHWLTYLAAIFLKDNYVGVGGPNIAPPGDGWIAAGVANSPGGPMHVLISDREAEHIPGCNMAFRKASLQEIGGFDPQFRAAGDDVDVCWRLPERGGKLGFSPAAVDWHHRRNSVRAYWKQQKGYGKAEALLERKWPARYNAAGHLSWVGRIYGKGLTQMLGSHQQRIYQGTWSGALFQSLYQPAPGMLWSLPLMPEWYLVIGVLGALSALGILWTPLLWATPLLALAIAAPMANAVLSGARASFSEVPKSGWATLKLRALIVALHLLQPLARLLGRLQHGLTPWRRHGTACFSLPRPRKHAIWSERWRAPIELLQTVEAGMGGKRGVVVRGGDFDGWDLEIRIGTLGAARLCMAIEEHGEGKQLARFRTWPRASTPALVALALLVALSAMAGMDLAWPACAALGAVAFVLGTAILWHCGMALAAVSSALETQAHGPAAL